MPRPPFLHSSVSSQGESSGTESGNDSRNNQLDANGNLTVNSTSTPGTSLHSSSGSGSFSGSLTGSDYTSVSSRSSGQFLPPPIDKRQQYPGFSFVFATDANHSKETVYESGPDNSMKYLKPIHQGQTDSLPPVRLPYFFTGFDWIDVDGQNCVVGVPHFYHEFG